MFVSFGAQERSWFAWLRYFGVSVEVLYVRLDRVDKALMSSAANTFCDVTKNSLYF